jgi:hypothetical protein
VSDQSAHIPGVDPFPYLYADLDYVQWRGHVRKALVKGCAKGGALRDALRGAVRGHCVKGGVKGPRIRKALVPNMCYL